MFDSKDMCENIITENWNENHLYHLQWFTLLSTLKYNKSIRVYSGNILL